MALIKTQDPFPAERPIKPELLKFKPSQPETRQNQIIKVSICFNKVPIGFPLTDASKDGVEFRPAPTPNSAFLACFVF